MKKYAVIFSTYKDPAGAGWVNWSKENVDLFKNLPEEYDLYLSVDVDWAPMSYYRDLFGHDLNYIPVSRYDSLLKDSMGIDFIDLWYQCDISTVNMFLKNEKPYDYYYFIEHDLFSDSWNNVFKELEDVEAGLICSHLHQHPDDSPILENVLTKKEWSWWTGEEDAKRFGWAKRLGCWGTFQRYSAELVKLLHTSRSGQEPKVFFEHHVPSVAYNNGIKIEWLSNLHKEGVLKTPIYHSKGNNQAFYNQPQNSFWVFLANNPHY